MLEIQETRLLTPMEVAFRLHRCEATVWRWLRSGRLRAIKVQGKYLIPAASLMEFVEIVGTKEG